MTADQPFKSRKIAGTEAPAHTPFVVIECGSSGISGNACAAQ
jgi:hypothetical protein